MTGLLSSAAICLRRSRFLRRIESMFLIATIAMFLLAPALVGEDPQGATLRGMVRDAAGKAVANAHVVLRGEKPPTTLETNSDADGRFAFNKVPAGAFIVTATSGPLSSTTITVTVSETGDQPSLNLVLGEQGAKKPPSSAQKDTIQAMQFADKPNFSIAAVTDWTAAGGHGSDSMLRTSEALTREAVNLKSGNTQPAAVDKSTGKAEIEESESALRAAVISDQQGFAANYKLGRFFVQSGRYKEAIAPLQAAYQADPANYDNEYCLAQALKMAGDAGQARDHVQRLLARRPGPDLHRVQGELDEKLGDPLSAVHEFQEAASEDPSEDNYFAWGAELLVHRAIWQAKEVFDEGVRLHPHSARMLTARGTTLFAVAMYDQAALDLCQASDLNPQSAEPYLFMGKIEVEAPRPLPCVVDKLARFLETQPNSALANYYYAVALWKQQGQANDPQVLGKVTTMLNRAINLDPKCADGYFQLGNLSAGQDRWEHAIGFYLKAIDANPDLSEAHYRLGVAYRHIGEIAKAKEQFQLHDIVARKQAAAVQRQRESVKQFVVVLPGQTGNQQTR